MAKARRATLKAISSPTLVPQRESALETTPTPEATASAAAPARRGDARDRPDMDVLYARIPRTVKRRVDVAKAMLGVELAELVVALLDAHVDPGDERKMGALERLLAECR